MNASRRATVPHNRRQDAFPETLAEAPAPINRAKNSVGRTHLAQDTVPGYEILGELGRGGMGVAYKARHIALDRAVALKMILAGVHASGTELDRFRNEARAVAQLKHPNVVQIYEFGEHNGLPYFSMELVEGGGLSETVDGRLLAPRAAAEMIEAIAQGVGAAHQRGIVHRDLKPGNVLMTLDGVPKIADFGLAKHLAEDGKTKSGMLLGTPAYMAPEQAAGRLREIGPPTDIYALGAMLHELLTGQCPFEGPPAVVLHQILTEEASPPSALRRKVPRDLDTICLTCLHKDPAQRYSTAADLAEDLRRFRRHEPIRARTTPIWRRAALWVRRQPAVAALAMLFLVCAIALGAVAMRPARPNAARAAEALIQQHAEETRLLEDRLRRAEATVKERDEENARVRQEEITRNRKEVAPLPELLDRKPAGVSPSLGLVLSLAELTLNDRQTRSIDVVVDRKNCQGPVLVELKGLPPGVVAKNVVIAADKDRADLALTAGPEVDENVTKLQVHACLGGTHADSEIKLTTKNPPRLRLEIAPFALKTGENRLADLRIERHRCKGPVAVSWEGVPAGVTVKPVTVPADQDTITVPFSCAYGSRRQDVAVTAIAQLAKLRADTQFGLTVVAPKTIAELKQLLAQPVTVDVRPNTPLKDVLAQLNDTYDLPTAFNVKGYLAAGIRNTDELRVGPFQAREVPLGRVLMNMLAKANAGTFIVRTGFVEITPGQPPPPPPPPFPPPPPGKGPPRFGLPKG